MYWTGSWFSGRVCDGVVVLVYLGWLVVVIVVSGGCYYRFRLDDSAFVGCCFFFMFCVLRMLDIYGWLPRWGRFV